MMIIVAALVLGVLFGALILIPRDRKFGEVYCFSSLILLCINSIDLNKQCSYFLDAGNAQKVQLNNTNKVNLDLFSFSFNF